MAQYLTNRRVGFAMRDNLFVAADDEKVFRHALAALTHKAIERFCDRWVYRLINLFPAKARREGFAYQWYLDQVERCHNLIFHEGDRLNALFGRLLDRGRAIGQPHVIARLFQRRRLHANRTGGTHPAHPPRGLLPQSVAQKDLHQTIQQTRRRLAHRNFDA